MPQTALRLLDTERVCETIALLQRRIEQRFPGSGLSGVCGQLLAVGRSSAERSRWIERPLWAIRGLVALLIAVIVIATGSSFLLVHWRQKELSLPEFLQASDACLQLVLVIGAAIFFLMRLEKQVKRRRALHAIHELRSLAHIIDMHQLTKDPERVLNRAAFAGSVAPAMEMTVFQLRRYLDYCSEMLSLVGKIAALYVQNFDDGVTLEAVNDVEQLATDLARKIWQKIMILAGGDGLTQRPSADDRAGVVPPAAEPPSAPNVRGPL